MSRGAFLSVFADEIKRGDAHAFFVNYTKWQTIDERERILADSKRKQEAFRATLPEAVREDAREVGRRMMKARIEERQKHGKSDDQWVVHPFPTLDEPHRFFFICGAHPRPPRRCNPWGASLLTAAFAVRYRDPLNAIFATPSVTMSSNSTYAGTVSISCKPLVVCAAHVQSDDS